MSSNTISKIFAGISLFLIVIALVYFYFIIKSRKAFIEEIKKWAENNPNDMVTKEDFDKIKAKFNKTFVRSMIYMIILIIAVSILSLISVFLR